MMKLISALSLAAAALAPALTFAADIPPPLPSAPASAASAAGSKAEEEVKALVPDEFMADVKPEDRKRMEALGREVTQGILSAYETKMKDTALTSAATAGRRRADAIADEAIQSERNAALDFLGIDPGAPTGLYVFVSYSMPKEMLRAYVIDAMWSGASVLFRGFPEGMTLGQFVMGNLKDLVYGKSAAANISIDPRMFDAYNVSVVPTIVFSKVTGNFQCQGIERVEFHYEDQTLGYDKCPPLDEKDYYKISGAVSMNYALEAFKDKGASEVGPYQRALAKGFAEGKVPPKEQTSFTGKWESVLPPDEAAQIRQMAKETGYDPATEAAARNINAKAPRNIQGMPLAPPSAKSVPTLPVK